MKWKSEYLPEQDYFEKKQEKRHRSVTTSHLPAAHSSSIFVLQQHSLTSYCSVKCFLLILSYEFQIILHSNSFLNSVCICSLVGIIYKLLKTES